MIRKDGQKLLKDFTEANFQETITQVTAGVWHVLGAGHSNAVFIEGESGVILIDTLDTLERGIRLSGIIGQKTGKKVSTVILQPGSEAWRWSGPIRPGISCLDTLAL